MAKRKPTTVPYRQPYKYASPDVPMSAIRRFARQIAEKFKPEKIVLFGSYAYGTPDNESDVDLLVIMPCRNTIDQALKIDLAFDRLFVHEVVVRRPKQVEDRFKSRDWFLIDALEKGKVLYEAENGSVGSKGRVRLPTRRQHRGDKPALSR